MIHKKQCITIFLWFLLSSRLLLSVLELHQILSICSCVCTLADFTADRELHPALKNTFIHFFYDTPIFVICKAFFEIFFTIFILFFVLFELQCIFIQYYMLLQINSPISFVPTCFIPSLNISGVLYPCSKTAVTAFSMAWASLSN